MNRNENVFKRYLVKIMGTRWDVQSHEDKYSVGIPDLSYGAAGVNGWIELKYIGGWKTPPQPVKPDKYSPEQVNWINRRGKVASSCFVMVKVGSKNSDYYILPYPEAKKVRKGKTHAEYERDSLASWSGSIDPAELISALTR